MRKPKPSPTVAAMLRDADAIVRDRRVSFEMALQTATCTRYIDSMNAVLNIAGRPLDLSDVIDDTDILDLGERLIEMYQAGELYIAK
jgi:hypothetical protein